MNNFFPFLLILTLSLIVLLILLKLFSKIFAIFTTTKMDAKDKKGQLDLKNKFVLHKKIFTKNFFSVLIQKKFGLESNERLVVNKIEVNVSDYYYLFLLKFFVLKIKKNSKFRIEANYDSNFEFLLDYYTYSNSNKNKVSKNFSSETLQNETVFTNLEIFCLILYGLLENIFIIYIVMYSISFYLGYNFLDFLINFSDHFLVYFFLYNNKYLTLGLFFYLILIVFKLIFEIVNLIGTIYEYSSTDVSVLPDDENFSVFYDFLEYLRMLFLIIIMLLIIITFVYDFVFITSYFYFIVKNGFMNWFYLLKNIFFNITGYMLVFDLKLFYNLKDYYNENGYVYVPLFNNKIPIYRPTIELIDFNFKNVTNKNLNRNFWRQELLNDLKLLNCLIEKDKEIRQSSSYINQGFRGTGKRSDLMITAELDILPEKQYFKGSPLKIKHHLSRDSHFVEGFLYNPLDSSNDLSLILGSLGDSSFFSGNKKMKPSKMYGTYNYLHPIEHKIDRQNNYFFPLLRSLKVNLFTLLRKSDKFYIKKDLNLTNDYVKFLKDTYLLDLNYYSFKDSAYLNNFYYNYENFSDELRPDFHAITPLGNTQHLLIKAFLGSKDEDFLFEDFNLNMVNESDFFDKLEQEQELINISDDDIEEEEDFVDEEDNFFILENSRLRLKPDYNPITNVLSPDDLDLSHLTMAFQTLNINQVIGDNNFSHIDLLDLNLSKIDLKIFLKIQDLQKREFLLEKQNMTQNLKYNKNIINFYKTQLLYNMDEYIDQSENVPVLHFWMPTLSDDKSNLFFPLKDNLNSLFLENFELYFFNKKLNYLNLIFQTNNSKQYVLDKYIFPNFLENKTDFTQNDFKIDFLNENLNSFFFSKKNFLLNFGFVTHVHDGESEDYSIEDFYDPDDIPFIENTAEYITDIGSDFGLIEPREYDFSRTEDLDEELFPFFYPQASFLDFTTFSRIKNDLLDPYTGYFIDSNQQFLEEQGMANSKFKRAIQLDDFRFFSYFFKENEEKLDLIIYNYYLNSLLNFINLETDIIKNKLIKNEVTNFDKLFSYISKNRKSKTLYTVDDSLHLLFFKLGLTKNSDPKYYFVFDELYSNEFDLYFSMYGHRFNYYRPWFIVNDIYYKDFFYNILDKFKRFVFITNIQRYVGKKHFSFLDRKVISLFDRIYAYDFFGFLPFTKYLSFKDYFKGNTIEDDEFMQGATHYLLNFFLPEKYSMGFPLPIISKTLSSKFYQKYVDKFLLVESVGKFFSFKNYDNCLLFAEHPYYKNISDNYNFSSYKNNEDRIQNFFSFQNTLFEKYFHKYFGSTLLTKNLPCTLEEIHYNTYFESNNNQDFISKLAILPTKLRSKPRFINVYSQYNWSSMKNFWIEYPKQHYKSLYKKLSYINLKSSKYSHDSRFFKFSTKLLFKDYQSALIFDKKNIALVKFLNLIVDDKVDFLLYKLFKNSKYVKAILLYNKNNHKFWPKYTLDNHLVDLRKLKSHPYFYEKLVVYARWIAWQRISLNLNLAINYVKDEKFLNPDDNILKNLIFFELKNPLIIKIARLSIQKRQFTNVFNEVGQYLIVPYLTYEDISFVKSFLNNRISLTDHDELNLILRRIIERTNTKQLRLYSELKFIMGGKRFLFLNGFDTLKLRNPKFIFVNVLGNKIFFDKINLFMNKFYGNNFAGSFKILDLNKYQQNFLNYVSQDVKINSSSLIYNFNKKLYSLYKSKPPSKSVVGSVVDDSYRNKNFFIKLILIFVGTFEYSKYKYSYFVNNFYKDLFFFDESFYFSKNTNDLNKFYYDEFRLTNSPFNSFKRYYYINIFDHKMYKSIFSQMLDFRLHKNEEYSKFYYEEFKNAKFNNNKIFFLNLYELSKRRYEFETQSLAELYSRGTTDVFLGFYHSIRVKFNKLELAKQNSLYTARYNHIFIDYKKFLRSFRYWFELPTFRTMSFQNLESIRKIRKDWKLIDFQKFLWLHQLIGRFYNQRIFGKEMSNNISIFRRIFFLHFLQTKTIISTTYTRKFIIGNPFDFSFIEENKLISKRFKKFGFKNYKINRMFYDNYYHGFYSGINAPMYEWLRNDEFQRQLLKYRLPLKSAKFLGKKLINVNEGQIVIPTESMMISSSDGESISLESGKATSSKLRKSVSNNAVSPRAIKLHYHVDNMKESSKMQHWNISQYKIRPTPKMLILRNNYLRAIKLRNYLRFLQILAHPLNLSTSRMFWDYFLSDDFRKVLLFDSVIQDFAVDADSLLNIAKVGKTSLIVDFPPNNELLKYSFGINCYKRLVETRDIFDDPYFKIDNWWFFTRYKCFRLKYFKFTTRFFIYKYYKQNVKLINLFNNDNIFLFKQFSDHFDNNNFLLNKTLKQYQFLSKYIILHKKLFDHLNFYSVDEYLDYKKQKRIHWKNINKYRMVIPHYQPYAKNIHETPFKSIHHIGVNRVDQVKSNYRFNSSNLKQKPFSYFIGNNKNTIRVYYPFKHESWYYSNFFATYPIDYKKLLFLSENYDEYLLIISTAIKVLKRKIEYDIFQLQLDFLIEDILFDYNFISIDINKNNTFFNELKLDDNKYYFYLIKFIFFFEKFNFFFEDFYFIIKKIQNFFNFAYFDNFIFTIFWFLFLYPIFLSYYLFWYLRKLKKFDAKDDFPFNKYKIEELEFYKSFSALNWYNYSNNFNILHFIETITSIQKIAEIKKEFQDTSISKLNLKEMKIAKLSVENENFLKIFNNLTDADILKVFNLYLNIVNEYQQFLKENKNVKFLLNENIDSIRVKNIFNLIKKIRVYNFNVKDFLNFFNDGLSSTKNLMFDKENSSGEIFVKDVNYKFLSRILRPLDVKIKSLLLVDEVVLKPLFLFNKHYFLEYDVSLLRLVLYATGIYLEMFIILIIFIILGFFAF
jgi:hypothetical protein